MKASMKETAFTPDREIQGLHYRKNAEAGFWSLKAKIELAIFQDPKKGETGT